MLRHYNVLLFPKEFLLIDDISNFEKILLVFLIDAEHNRRSNQIDINYLISSINKPFNKIRKSLNSLERKGYLAYALTSEYNEFKSQIVSIYFFVNLEKIYNQ